MGTRKLIETYTRFVLKIEPFMLITEMFTLTNLEQTSTNRR